MKLVLLRLSLGLKRHFKITLLALIVLIILGPAGYAGAYYYQSAKLVKEADQLVKDGRYEEAISKYDKASQKWRWQSKKINPKKDKARTLLSEDKNLKDGEASFGNGEWQKCMDYLRLVTVKHPNFVPAMQRYSDCKKKLDEEVAAAAAAEAKAAADAAAAQAAAAKSKTAAKPKTTISSPSASTSVPALPTTEWKTYTSEKYGFSFSYPTRMYTGRYIDPNHLPEYTGYSSGHNADLSHFMFYPPDLSSGGGVSVTLRGPDKEGDYAAHNFDNPSFVQVQEPFEHSNFPDFLTVEVHDTSVTPAYAPLEDKTPWAGMQETTQYVPMANGQTCKLNILLGQAQSEGENLSYLTNHFLPNGLLASCVAMVGKYEVTFEYHVMYPHHNAFLKTPYYDYQNTWSERNAEGCKIDWQFKCTFNGHYWTDAAAFYRDLTAGHTEPISRMFYQNVIRIAQSINF